jgi:hypothetical protein
MMARAYVLDMTLKCGCGWIRAWCRRRGSDSEKMPAPVVNEMGRGFETL